MFEPTADRLQLDINSLWSIYLYIQTAMLGTREYILCSPFRANAHNYSSRGPIGIYCADLSTIVQFGTDADQTIINSFFEGAKAGARWGRHIG